MSRGKARHRVSRPLADGRADCSHIPEAHVVYSAHEYGYQATVRCRCGRISVRGEDWFQTVASAEDVARVLLQRYDCS